ncbi:MAG: hypothetical protein CVV27_11770, partial [Candidatus Melainabacteria bacterium HGW-Melainabacteria-1]
MTRQLIWMMCAVWLTGCQAGQPTGMLRQANLQVNASQQTQTSAPSSPQGPSQTSAQNPSLASGRGMTDASTQAVSSSPERITAPPQGITAPPLGVKQPLESSQFDYYDRNSDKYWDHQELSAYTVDWRAQS